MNDREKLTQLLHSGRDKYFLLEFEAALLADHLLANGVTVRRWIPVTERLPEKQGEYFVMIEGDKISTTLYYEWADKYWFDFPNGRKFVVTHWMPLPEPPKEE